MRILLYAIALLGMLALGLRLMPVYLASDGLALASELEFWFFASAGAITAIVLTSGNAILAHKLAKNYGKRSMLWWILLVFWFMYLVGAVVLIAPYIVSGIEKGELGQMLRSSFARWVWSITSIVLVECTIAAIMASSVLDVQHAKSGKGKLDQLADAALDAMLSKMQTSKQDLQEAVDDYSCSCGFVGKNHRSLNAHRRFCKNGSKSI